MRDQGGVRPFGDMNMYNRLTAPALYVTIYL